MRPSTIIVPVIAAVLLAVGGGFTLWWATREPEPLSLELTTPKLAMEQFVEQGAKPIFFTLAAVPYLKEHWKQWERAFGPYPSTPEELALQFETTAQSPQAWRVLDRKWHFDLVLLAGDPAAFSPLLEHLRSSPDWTLVQLDPSSIVFKRSPARRWTTADLVPLLAVFQARSAEEQNRARVLIAHRLMFLGEMPAAKGLLNEVLTADPKSVAALTELASMHGMLGQWPESIKIAARALALDRNYRPAQFVQANAFYALGRFPDALEVTRRLFVVAPSDGPSLLMHAKTTHAAHSFGEEIAVLQQLIGLMQSHGQPVGLWQIYLGQAYASTGAGNLSEDQFKAALLDESLSAEDRAFAQKGLERLGVKTMLNNVPSFPKEASLLDAPAYRP